MNKLTLTFSEASLSGKLSLSKRTWALVFLFIAIFIWAGNWPVMKSGLEHVTPLWFSALRFILGGCALFAFQCMAKSLYRPSKRDLPLIMSVGLIQMMGFTVLGAIAMKQVDAGRSAVLAYTTTLWVIPFSVCFFNEKIKRNSAIGLALGLLGVVALFNPFEFDWKNRPVVVANTLLLLAALGWSICILHIRHSKSKASAIQLAPWQMLVAAIPLTFLSLWIEGPFTGDGSTELWLICLYLGPLATAFCFCAVNDASRLLPSSIISIAMLGVPVLGLLLSIIFLDEAISLSLIFGALLILAGLFCVVKAGDSQTLK